ncbi:MAG: hypothetical protein ABSE63_10085 [Thermoguttaceae bacterium]|jgi:hypothetical protein
MSITIALVPIVSLCALVLLFLGFASLRSSRIAELKHEHNRFTQNVVEQDGVIQNVLLNSLLDGRSPSECLATFEQQRAALLPGARLEEPAGWETEELAEYARQQFKERLAEVNRKLGVATLTIAVVIISACVVLTAVLYNFQTGATNALDAATSSTGNATDSPAAPVQTNDSDSSTPTDSGAPHHSPADSDAKPADAGASNSQPSST